MLPVITTQQNDTMVLLTRPFFAQRDRQADRDLHAHGCMELSYVLSGTADHILQVGDSDVVRQKLTLGNYLLLDTAARHAYKNCSADFAVMNLLFHPAFLREGKEADAAKEDLNRLLLALFPQFPFDRLAENPVNRLYFDCDDSVQALVHLCHNASRRHYPAWECAVRHALSLILLQSLYSLDQGTSPRKTSIIDTVKAYVEEHYAEKLTLTEICAKHFYSVPYVSSRFKYLCGCSFEQFLRQVRVRHAGELLLSTTLSVGEIAEACGYTSSRAFRNAFSHVAGMAPLQFKRQYQK
jgi:AraC-like DNA-binding protein